MIWSLSNIIFQLKFTLHEGGVRGTAALYSPLLATKSLIDNNLMHLVDILPTLFSAAGGSVEDLGLLDGIDHWAAISGLKSSLDSTHKAEINLREELLLNIDEVGYVSAIIGHQGRYKLLKGNFGQ